MGVRDETLKALRSGFTPGQISESRGVSLQTTLAYLNQMVGEGRLRRSDILFSVPKEIRQAIAEAESRGEYPKCVDADDVHVVKLYGNAAHALGDMYDDLRETESTLHMFIRWKLITCFGESEAGWWRQGVPELIRKTCQTRREEDAEPVADAYAYTDLLDLGKIIEANWAEFRECLPAEYQNNRKRLLEHLRCLNGIRRMVMHPVRGTAPSEADFDFLRDFKKLLYPRIAEAVESLQQASSP